MGGLGRLFRPFSQPQDYAASGRDTGWQHGEAEEVLEYRLYSPNWIAIRQADASQITACSSRMLPDDVGWAWPPSPWVPRARRWPGLPARWPVLPPLCARGRGSRPTAPPAPSALPPHRVAPGNPPGPESCLGGSSCLPHPTSELRTTGRLASLPGPDPYPSGRPGADPGMPSETHTGRAGDPIEASLQLSHQIGASVAVRSGNGHSLVPPVPKKLAPSDQLLPRPRFRFALMVPKRCHPGDDRG